MSIAVIFSIWINGSLVFIKLSDGTAILAINPDGSIDIQGKFLKNERFELSSPLSALADLGKVYFIAPAACKIVSAYESHSIKATVAGSVQVEKLTSGQAPGSGVTTLATAFDMTSNNDVPLTVNSNTDASATLAAGDRFALKLSGTGTTYAQGLVTLTMQYI